MEKRIYIHKDQRDKEMRVSYKVILYPLLVLAGLLAFVNIECQSLARSNNATSSGWSMDRFRVTRYLPDFIDSNHGLHKYLPFLHGHDDVKKTIDFVQIRECICTRNQVFNNKVEEFYHCCGTKFDYLIHDVDYKTLFLQKYNQVKKTVKECFNNYSTKFNEYKLKYMEKLNTHNNNKNGLFHSNVTIISDDNHHETETYMSSTMAGTAAATTTVDVVPAYAVGTVNGNSYLDDFEVLFDIIDGKSNKIVDKLNDKIMKFQKRKLNDFKPFFTSELQKLNEIAFNHSKLINKAVLDIDCTANITTDGNETHYFNLKNDEECPEYITRVRMRELFADAIKDCEHYTNEIINDDLNQQIQLINEELLEIRETYVDFFEEWADSLMNKLKHSLVTEDLQDSFMANDDMIEDNDQSEKMLPYDDGEDSGNSYEVEEEDTEYGKWDKYMGLKKKLIKKRQEIMEMDLQIMELDQFIKDIKQHLKILSAQGAEMFGILRAQANLQFQLREEEEFLKKKQEEEEAIAAAQRERKEREEAAAREAADRTHDGSDDEEDDDDEVVTETVIEVVQDQLTETFTQTSTTTFVETHTELVL